jgi:hypothetical protein
LALTGGSCSRTTEFFRHGRSRALQKPFTIHYSPFATCCRFGLAGASPSHSPSILKL